MKKIFVFFCFLLISQNSFAQEDGGISLFSEEAAAIHGINQIIEANKSLFNMKYDDELSLESLQDFYDHYNEYMIEAIPMAIRTLPKVYWQYIVPSLYVTPFMPEEVLNIPEFLEYKGKKPTLIDPDWQEYADKYLDDLHPSLYIYVIPRKMLAKEGDQNFLNDIELHKDRDKNREYPPKDFLKDQPQSLVVARAFEREPAEKYASGKYLEEKPDTGRASDIDENTNLRGGDVLAFIKTLPDAALIAKKNIEFKSNTNTPRADAIAASDGKLLFKSPCSDFVSDLDKNLLTGFNLILQKHDFDAKSWGLVCDRTIKAYRLYSMSLRDKETIFKMFVEKEKLARSQKLTTDGEKLILDMINQVEEMYSGDVKDLAAVKWYMDEIAKAFRDSELGVYLKTEL